MSWLYSAALVAEYLGENFLDGEQSVQSSGKPIPQAYCAPDKMTDFSRLSRFGMTFKPLTENLGEELLTSFRAVFPARTFQPLEKGQELKESEAECGEKWRGSFTKYDQDSSLWKTHQCSLLGDLDEFSETWPQWGLMRDGECWERQTLEQTIRGTGYGFSPNGIDKFHTPCTTGLDGGSNSRKALKKRLLPTPDASQRGPTKDYDPKAKSQSGRTLQSFAAKFPTPQASDNRDRAI
jgi:DNA (cytosine-5)-methyltransferase 1